MVAANNADFLEGSGGTVDPFTGLAPAETPEEEATRRLLRLRYAAQQTANANAQYGEDRQRQQTGQEINPATGQPYTGDERPSTGNFWKEAGQTIAQHPWLLALPAAPFAVAGAGAAMTGAGLGETLGFGAGEGSLVGPAVTPATQVANEATGLATAGPGFSPEAANAYNAAHAAGAAGGAVGGGAGGGAAGAFKTFGLPALEALGPLAIQQMTGGRTKEQKQLIEAQKQMALEAQKRQGQVQDQRMDMLAQQVLAFNPRNQMLAQMVGPQAAFSPEAAAQMVQGPEPPMDQNLLNYAGNDQAMLKQKAEMIRRHNEWLQHEQQRRDMMMGSWQPTGPGPAPINMPAPQAARRF